MIFTGYITGFIYAAFCLVIAGIAYKLGVPKKFTRKIVHILIGFEWLILYHFFGSGIHFLIVCIFFLLLLIISHKTDLLRMISSDSDNSPGTVYYAVAMTAVAVVGCFAPWVMLPFGIGVFCTSFGDGFAGVVGQIKMKFNPVIYGKKTLFGTLTNLIVSSSSALILSTLYNMNLSPWQCLFIGILSTELELVSDGGLDNISITWGATALTCGFMFFDTIGNYLVPILVTAPFIILVISKKALTTDGIIAALVVDLLVSLAFGNFGFVTLSIFFAGAVIIDKIKKRIKKEGRNEIEAKGDCRDAMQVLANGLPAAIVAVVYLFTKNSIFIVPFVASVAEAFSDTSASGIGAFSKYAFDPFKMKKCDRGISGGMSVRGTASSLVASFIIAFSALLWNADGYGIKEALIAGSAGFIGAIFDSFLGSVFQVKYKCSVCGKITERAVHCYEKNSRISGFACIDNDVVNLLSCAFAATVAISIVLIV